MSTVRVGMLLTRQTRLISRAISMIVDQLSSGRVLAGSISSVGDHKYTLLTRPRSKQLSSDSVFHAQCLLDFLVIVIESIITDHC